MRYSTNYFINIYIREIKEIHTKSVVLNRLIHSLYDGGGKEIIEDMSKSIEFGLEKLVIEGGMIKEELEEILDKSL